MKKNIIYVALVLIILQSCDVMENILNPTDPEAVYASISEEEIQLSADNPRSVLTLTNDCPFELRVNVLDKPDWITINEDITGIYSEIVPVGGSAEITFDLNLFRAETTGTFNETFSIRYINKSKFDDWSFENGKDAKTFDIQLTALIQNTIEVTGFPVDWDGSSCEAGIEIGGTGADQLDWEIETEKTWLTADPASGSGSSTITFTAVSSDDLYIGNNRSDCDFISDCGRRTKTVSKEVTSTGSWIAYIPGLKASNYVMFSQSNGNVYVASVNWDTINQTYSGALPYDEIDSMGEFSLSLDVPTFSYFYFSGDFESVQTVECTVNCSEGEYQLAFEHL